MGKIKLKFCETQASKMAQSVNEGYISTLISELASQQI